MKLKHIIFSLVLVFTVSFLPSCSSTKVTNKDKKELKNGWTKNPNNPHHPKTTNPGHTKNKNKNKNKGNNGNGKGKGKGKGKQ